MKKTRKSSKKGFTLVELIVVLVILAILAAMLVPALTGYIRRARQEKDYQMAATVLTAAQAAATYQYSLGATGTISEGTEAGNGETVAKLVGTGFTGCQFATDGSGIITSGTVTIGSYTYSWNGSSWSANSATT
ncbi:MAG: type II secretion system GspH family protein [Saccharofermentans sp.]|nr:type II secretion system GspH family protein [Saccharofermentans sp.]